MDTFTTLEDAKQFLRDNWEKGVPCPCCKQMVKKYQRKLTTTMVLGLIDLYKQAGKSIYNGVHIKKIHVVNGGEFAQMKRWGLIRDTYNDDENKRTSGIWYLTQRGIDFVEGNMVVPESVYTYNGQTLSMTSKYVNIREALGNKFSYKEMMEAQ